MTKQGQAVPEVVSLEVWQAELEKLLVQEKKLTRHRDAVNAARRRLPA